MNIGEHNMDVYETQSNLLKALSHSTRLAILDILRDDNNAIAFDALGDFEPATSLYLPTIDNSETGRIIGISA